jgi:uncharacterized protein YutE (UPF0331/DUF86 family)
MTDPTIVLRKLSALREHVVRLRRRRPATADPMRDDIDLQDAIAMSLVVAVQSALDVAMHLLSDVGAGVPATYADSFRMLTQHGFLDAETSTRLAAMAALCNRIAHGYASVDFERIWRELPDGLTALDRFAQCVAASLPPGTR